MAHSKRDWRPDISNGLDRIKKTLVRMSGNNRWWYACIPGQPVDRKPVRLFFEEKGVIKKQAGTYSPSLFTNEDNNSLAWRCLEAGVRLVTGMAIYEIDFIAFTALAQELPNMPPIYGKKERGELHLRPDQEYLVSDAITDLPAAHAAVPVSDTPALAAS